MCERVVRCGVQVMWEPNVPDALMISGDSGRSVLAVRAHPDDEDQRNVVLVWNRVESASLSAPNMVPAVGCAWWDGRAGECARVVAVAAFAGAYVLIATEKINRVAVARRGHRSCLTLGATSPEHALFSEDAGIDWNIVFLLLGMMLIVGAR